MRGSEQKVSYLPKYFWEAATQTSEDEATQKGAVQDATWIS